VNRDRKPPVEHRIRKRICKRDGARQDGTAETPRAWYDFGLPVCPGQLDFKRRPETAEMRVVVLITQRPPTLHFRASSGENREYSRSAAGNPRSPGPRLGTKLGRVDAGNLTGQGRG
jgi:hypothetical protein